jgi:1-deoxy-D-xylulose-5-phosphate reductoisomerase
MRKIVILGSTGSIGKSLINIIKKDKKKFKIELLTTNKNYKKIIEQAVFFNVKNIIISDKKSFLISKKILKNKRKNINIYNNFNQLNKIFKYFKVDYTMNAISGFAGLEPTLKIIRFSKKIAIANKESIICGWQLIKDKLKKHKTHFTPIDSEHFSIWSLISNLKNNNIEKVFITASGGPFKDRKLNTFKSITTTDALKHPNWSMGKKITIDSATMMNKVFEIIEAKKIFNLNYNQLEILVHSQSYIHAIVKFTNGLTKILIHDTNMTIPIFNSLYEDSRKKIFSNKVNLSILNNLNLSKVDIKRFPVIRIIKDLPSRDTLFETVLVSANDTLVNLFLNKKIKFLNISKQLLKIVKMREFAMYKSKYPKNIKEIKELSDYVSLKVHSMSI